MLETCSGVEEGTSAVQGVPTMAQFERAKTQTLFYMTKVESRKNETKLRGAKLGI